MDRVILDFQVLQATLDSDLISHAKIILGKLAENPNLEILAIVSTEEPVSGHRVFEYFLEYSERIKVVRYSPLSGSHYIAVEGIVTDQRQVISSRIIFEEFVHSLSPDLYIALGFFSHIGKRCHVGISNKNLRQIAFVEGMPVDCVRHYPPDEHRTAWLNHQIQLLKNVEKVYVTKSDFDRHIANHIGVSFEKIADIKCFELGKSRSPAVSNKPPTSVSSKLPLVQSYLILGSNGSAQKLAASIEKNLPGAKCQLAADVPSGRNNSNYAMILGQGAKCICILDQQTRKEDLEISLDLVCEYFIDQSFLDSQNHVKLIKETFSSEEIHNSVLRAKGSKAVFSGKKPVFDFDYSSLVYLLLNFSARVYSNVKRTDSSFSAKEDGSGCLIAVSGWEIGEVILKSDSPSLMEKVLVRLQNEVKGQCPTAQYDEALTKALIDNYPHPLRKRHLFLDVSEIYGKDWRSGIQRYVHEYVANFHKLLGDDIVIVPVVAFRDVGRSWYYYSAFKWLLREYNADCDLLFDDEIEYHEGDIYYCIDLTGLFIFELEGQILSKLKAKGVKIYITVYDILPIRLPEFFPNDMWFRSHTNWLTACVDNADRLVCISQSTMHDVADWFQNVYGSYRKKLNFSAVHLGGDFVKKEHVETENTEFKNWLTAKKTFLMVGTLEPRKGHFQVLSGFQKLWEKNEPVQLLFIGRPGWENMEFYAELRAIAKSDSSFKWLEGADDATLTTAYKNSAALIYASYGEGFGLPIVEAAHHKIPIITRDIPVFREIVHEHGFYFTGKEPEAISDAVLKWLELERTTGSPSSLGIESLTWHESARLALSAVGLLPEMPPSDFMKHLEVTR